MNPFVHSFRASARRAPLVSPRIPKAHFRSSFRRFSTEAPPPKSSNVGLYATIGLALAGGIGYYVYSSSDTAATTVKSGAQSAKSALKFTPTKADYQKVTDFVILPYIARGSNSTLRCTTGLPTRSMTPAIMMVRLATYLFPPLSHFLPPCQMALLGQFSSVSRGTVLALMTRKLRLAAGTDLPFDMATHAPRLIFKIATMLPCVSNLNPFTVPTTVSTSLVV
jgi:hypothetical protein